MTDTPTQIPIAARLATLGFLLVIGAGITIYDVFYRFPVEPNPGPERIVRVSVPKGAGPKTLANRLETAGLTNSPGRFALWLRVTKGMKGVKAGEFEVPKNLSPTALMERLRGRTTHKGTRVLIPEGFTLTQIGSALESAQITTHDAFIRAATHPNALAALGILANSAEGYLFPDTYYFEKKSNPKKIVETMVAHFRRQIEPLNISKESLPKIITLASIVQAETGHNDEMPIIAGVYQNRLDETKHPTRRLQADPTVAYGCEPYVVPQAPSCKTFKGILGRKQLDDPENPYNTYRHAGLPPGPISAPGQSAIRAAIAPKQVPYLYFVASGNQDGRHIFSTTLAEHEAAVKRYRKSRLSR